MEILESVKTCINKAVENLKGLNISPKNIKCEYRFHDIKQ